MSASSYSFRALAPGDRPAVDRICAHSFEDGDYIPEVYDAWLADPDAHFYGVFDQRGELLGIGRLRPIDGGTTVWCEGDRVASEHRRRGLGRALLMYAVDWARARGARRLRAMVDSDNEASMRLFASSGFHVAVRFERWVAEPGPGGRLPRPLPIDELDNAMAFVRRSIPFQASNGTYAPGWTIYDLDMERLALHMESQEALLAGDSIGALGIVTNFVAGSEGAPILAFLCGAPVAVTHLLRGVRTLAHLRGLDEVRALIPEGAGLEGMLSHAGFVRRTSSQLVLQQLDLA